MAGGSPCPECGDPLPPVPVRCACGWQQHAVGGGVLVVRHANWRDALIADAMVRLPQRRKGEPPRDYADRCRAEARARAAATDPPPPDL